MMLPRTLFSLALLSFLSITCGTFAFVQNFPRSSSSSTKFELARKATQENDDELVAATTSSTRRQFGQQLLFGGAALTSSLPAFAAKDSAAEDKERIVKGYNRLNYLLDHWETETSFCGTEIDPYSGKRKCERTPTKVMDFMGYKSTNDPLFKAEKTLRRLEALAPAEREGDYLDAVEKWTTAADEASGMAYTSSWAGPQNPNGGDESIEYFLDRAKQQVVTARNVLKDVIDILGLQTTTTA